jgi:hypothetical protein
MSRSRDGGRPRSSNMTFYEVILPDGSSLFYRSYASAKKELMLRAGIRIKQVHITPTREWVLEALNALGAKHG